MTTPKGEKLGRNFRSLFYLGVRATFWVAGGTARRIVAGAPQEGVA